MNLRPLVIVLLLGGSVLQSAPARPPNLLVVLTDDQGWGDVSAHGNTNLTTPNIDRLAREGAAIPSFYVCPVCAPTRAEFLTGRYHPRTGVSGVSRGEERIAAGESILAEVFRDAGYATGAFGKWHNGTQPPLHPNQRGFDTFYGFTSGHWGHYFSPPLDRNGKRVRGKGFIVDDCTDHALAFIDTHRDRPFFCYVPFNTPHSPMFVPDRWYRKFAGREPGLRHRDPEREDLAMTRAALALVENLDWNLGRLLRRLAEHGLERDTIVVFFSDNGPNSWRWNGGLKGRKGSLDEGGLRVPCFVRWPGRIRPGLRIPQVAGAIDLRPTLLELAGLADSRAADRDGRSLAPLLRETPGAAWPERLLFASWRGKVSVRSRRFRLDPAGRLFDLAADPGQRTDVAAMHPAAAERLRRAAADHTREMQRAFAAHRDRPFHVGFGPSTTLPARDGVPHGEIRRSSKAPNHSFFTHWTRDEDSITWDIRVGHAGTYRATVWHTCPAAHVGAEISLGVDGGPAVRALVREAFDPSLYDKSKERVTGSHYFVKDFKPLELGALRLEAGRATLRLGAVRLPGDGAIDVQAVDLERVGAAP